MKKDDKVLNLRNTITGLKYIAESPEQKLGGFHEYSILTARSALHHIKLLKGKVDEKKQRD